MEPVSVIGLGASVIGTIDVITRTIGALRKLQQRWKSTDMIVGALLGQLSTLKAALDQIRQWVQRSLAGVPENYQMAMDLEASLDSCKVLVSIMDSYISELDWTEADTLTFESKMKAMSHDSSIKECSSHLGHQCIALNLLLTALNCQSLSEQKSILEASESRRVLNQVKDDTSSLIVLRDSDSFCSSWATSTERSSVVNRVFDFDGEVLMSKVYQSSMRSLIRRVFRKRQVPYSLASDETQRFEVKMWARDDRDHEFIDATIDKTSDSNIIPAFLVERLSLEIHPLPKERFIRIYDGALQEHQDYQISEFVRPKWQRHSQQQSKVHTEFDFMILPISPESSVAFERQLILGKDYLIKLRGNYQDLLGPQISRATQINYY